MKFSPALSLLNRLSFLTILSIISCGLIWTANFQTNTEGFKQQSPFKNEGRVLKTDHYLITYNTPKVSAEKMAAQLKNLRENFLKIFTPEFDLSAPEQRMRVYLFKTEGDYRQYISGKIPQMSDYSGLYDIQTKTLILLDPQGSSGYQKAVEELGVLEHRLEETQRRIEFHEQRLTGRVPGDTKRGQEWLSEQKKKQHEAEERKLRMALNLKIRALNKFFVATLHEGTHQLRDATGLWLVSPLWLEEGVAEYFSDAEYGRKESAEIGTINKLALKEFKEAHSRGALIPLKRLLTWGVSTPVNQQIVDKDQVPTVYSEFWALFYFFLHADSGRWREPFFSYIHDLRKNPPSLNNNLDHLARFKKMVNSDLSHFEQVWIKTVLTWN